MAGREGRNLRLVAPPQCRGPGLAVCASRLVGHQGSAMEGHNSMPY